VSGVKLQVKYCIWDGNSLDLGSKSCQWFPYEGVILVSRADCEVILLIVAYNVLLTGSNFHSCRLPVLDCSTSPSSVLFSDRR
jgi:hypothetical protein